MHRVESLSLSLFFYSRDIFFRISTFHLCLKYTSTSEDIHQLDTTKNRWIAKVSPIDTFMHEEKYQLFVFTWSVATPFYLPCPTSHSPRTLNGTQPSYTASPFIHGVGYTTLGAMSMYRQGFSPRPPP